MVRRGMRLNELANRLAVAADLRFDPQDVFRRAILIPYSMLARTAVTVKAASRGAGTLLGSPPAPPANTFPPVERGARLSGGGGMG